MASDTLLSNLTLRVSEARESLKWLRGKGYNIEKEIQELKTAKATEDQNGAISFYRWSQYVVFRLKYNIYIYH